MTTVSQLITDALNECAIRSDLESYTASELVDARNTLNQLLFSMPNLGKQIFKRAEASHTFTTSVSAFNLPTTYYDLDDAFIRYNNADTPLEALSVEEYREIYTKNSSGFPKYYNLLYKTDFSLEVRLYPKPELVTSTGYIFHYLGILNHIAYSQDSETLSSPHNFYLAIKWALAEQLCNRYDVPMDKRVFISKMKKESLKLANATNVGLKTSFRIRSAF